MRMLDLIPAWFKDYVRLLARKRRFPDCVISSAMTSAEATLGRGCMISRNVEVGPLVRIGDYTYVNAGSIVASGRIGKFCSIGYYCQIGLPEHPTSHLSTSPCIYGRRNILGRRCSWNDYQRPPVIGNDVWIASQAIVLQGVEIGDRAVVGAGSVVTRNVDPFTIVCGVPARPVRKRFSEDQIRALLDLRWWDMSRDELRRNAARLPSGDLMLHECRPSMDL